MLLTNSGNLSVAKGTATFVCDCLPKLPYLESKAKPG